MAVRKADGRGNEVQRWWSDAVRQSSTDGISANAMRCRVQAGNPKGRQVEGISGGWIGIEGARDAGDDGYRWQAVVGVHAAR